MAGKIKLPHVCPKCKETIAKDYEDLEKKFGFRNISEEKEASITNQSWCRECRKNSSKEKLLKK